jgi:cobalt/nickel transport system permease protein
MVVLCITANSIIYSTIVIVLMMTAGILFANVPLKRYFLLCLIPAGFILVGVLTIAISIQDAPFEVVSWPMFGHYFGFSESGLMMAANLALKSFGCVISLYFLYLTTPITAVLGMLYKLPLPKIFIEIMMLTYRFIFDLLNTGRQMHTSQNARLSNLSRKSTLKATGILASGIFVRSFKKSTDIYNAMEARGYDGTLPYYDKKVGISMAEITVIVAVTLVMVALLIAIKTVNIPVISAYL